LARLDGRDGGVRVSTTIGAQRFAERLAATGHAVAEHGLTAMLVGVGPELEWLTGYAAVGHERLNLLVIPSRGEPVFLGPRLELEAARQAPGLAGGGVRLETWSETEDPYPRVPALIGSGATAGSDASAGVALLLGDGLRAAFVLGLQRVLPGASWGLASSVLADLRRTKDVEELAQMREAASAADRVVAAVSTGRLVGRTEADVAREVRERLVDEGHDTAEFAIVASGPHSASPHHEPGGRVIGAGEPLLLDIGGRHRGYCSDTTRTVWIAAQDGTAPDGEFVAIHRLVEEAQAAARGAVRPGVRYADLDAVARDHIATGGFGERFIHRLGHGIGLEVHEEPYVVSTNADRLRVGDTFSIEPGIYVEGRYGVRIEDVMVVTAQGGMSLNETERGLRVVAGR
jgi:Xaa-Pro aminopeptidase